MVKWYPWVVYESFILYFQNWTWVWKIFIFTTQKARTISDEKTDSLWRLWVALQNSKKFTMSVKRLKSYIGGCQFCQLLIPIYFSDCLDSYLNIFSNMSSIIIVNFNSVTFTSPTWQTNELSYIVTQKQLPTKLRPREQENYFIIHKNWPPRIQMIP